MKKVILLACAVAIAGTVSAAEPKGTNSNTGGGVINATGGPDGFGYTFADSAEANCAFNFIDISATGTNLGNGDDVAFTTALSTTFNFYGAAVTDIAVASNGYISTDLTDTGPDLSNDCPLPAAPSTGGGARIYPLHDDLVVNGAMFVEYFASCPRASDDFPGEDLGCHVIMWDDVIHFNGAASFQFEAILYDDSYEIVFQHNAGNDEAGSGSTTGIQNLAADDGLTYACDTAASVAASSAQCFFHPEPNVVTVVYQVPSLAPVGLGVLGLGLAFAGLISVRRRKS